LIWPAGRQRWLACFGAVADAGCAHKVVKIGSGAAVVNTAPGNIKAAITGTYRAIDQKHVLRYLAEFEYHFNRRYDLAAMMPRLAWAAVRTTPMPYWLLKLADVCAWAGPLPPAKIGWEKCMNRMGFDQPPVDLLGEERIDMLVANGFAKVEMASSQLQIRLHQQSLDSPDQTARRYVEFFTAHIRNPNTRRTYACACDRFFQLVAGFGRRGWLAGGRSAKIA
jgi:hypothetical protein